MKCARSCGGDEDVARAPAVAGVEGGGVGIVEVPHRAHVRRRKEQVAYGPIQRRLRRFWFRLEVVDGFVQIAVVGVARRRRDDVSRLGSPHARQAFANLPEKSSVLALLRVRHVRFGVHFVRGGE